MSIPRAGITPRAKVLLPLFLIVLMVASYYRVWRGRDEHPGPYALQGRTMGTTYNIVVAQVQLSKEQRQDVQASIQRELDRVEGLMSTYRPESELSRFNAARETTPFPVGEDTRNVVQAAKTIAEQSGGAFDVTVRPLVALWGFGAGANATPPTAEQVSQARARVGSRHLSVDGGALVKAQADLELDLSAIAKGYAVDRVAEVLERHGIRHSMVEVGGEIRVSGQKRPGVAWRLGVEAPTEASRTTQTILELSDIGMATSGDYRNYYEQDGVRISHTIDPRTGRPITHNLASVTVLHPSAMWADGYATALSVLGPDAGMRFAAEHGLGAYFILRNPDGTFTTRSSPEFLRQTQDASMLR